MYELVDTHAHLDEIPNLQQILQRARGSSVLCIIAVGVDYESNNHVLEIAAKHGPLVFPALGCHPGNLPQSPEEVERNLHFIQDNLHRAVAIGEIGLDYHKMILPRATKDRQKQVLQDVLAIARQYNKPSLLHSRYAWRDTFDLVRESAVRLAVFHWYTGPTSVLRDIIGAGYFCSATIAAEYHEEHRRTIREVPLDKLLLETDCPVVYRSSSTSDRPSEPADVTRVLQAVAQLRQENPHQLANITTDNALGLFGIHSQFRREG